MSTISIHDLDAELERRLRKLARERGESLNKTIKELLASGLGCRSRRSRNRGRFDRFCGLWSQKDLEDFTAAARDFGEIDRGDWQ